MTLPVQIDLLTIGLILLSLAALFVFLLLFGSGAANDPKDFAGRKRRLSFGPLTHALAAIFPLLLESPENLQKDLIRAGFYHRYAAREHLATRNFMLICWSLLMYAFYQIIVPDDPNMHLPVLAVAIVVGVVLFSLPRLLLQAQAGARVQRIQFSLPDALDMITMMMTGGVPMVQALHHASRELRDSHPDVACELTIVTRQTEARSLDTALDGFAERIDIPDVQSLAALVSQTERLGANITTAFKDYSDSVRRSLRQRAEERGNKASVQLLLPVVFCLAPPVYILLLAPALLEMRSFMNTQTQSGGVLSQDDAAAGQFTQPLSNFQSTSTADDSPADGN